MYGLLQCITVEHATRIHAHQKRDDTEFKKKNQEKKTWVAAYAAALAIRGRKTVRTPLKARPVRFELSETRFGRLTPYLRREALNERYAIIPGARATRATDRLTVPHRIPYRSDKSSSISSFIISYTRRASGPHHHRFAPSDNLSPQPDGDPPGFWVFPVQEGEDAEIGRRAR